MFGRRKDFDGIAARNHKLASNFIVAIRLTGAIYYWLWLRNLINQEIAVCNCAMNRFIRSAIRRSLDASEETALGGLIEGSKALANAFRLMQDASDLFDLGRYASSVALASVSIEEIGKFLLCKWTEQDPIFTFDERRLHAMKQSAVAALFFSDDARAEYKDRGIKIDNMHTPEDVAELVRAIVIGLERKGLFAEASSNQGLERAK